MSIQVSSRNGRAILSVAGRFDFPTHGEFRHCADQGMATPGLTGIEVRLDQVEYMDSASLGMLLVLRDRVQKAGMETVSLSGSRGRVKEILLVAKFERLFALC